MTSHATLAHRLGAAWTTVVGAVARFSRSVANRRRIAPVLDLSDRELRDIGLTRDDLRAALSHPLPGDPSVVLMVRAVDRRSRMRIVQARRAASRPVKAMAA